MLTLKNYQENALESLRDYFRLCHLRQNADTAFYELTRQQYGQGLTYNSVKELPGMPYICLRLPTGGGKTLVACHSINIAQTELMHADTSVVLWLVPSNPIREQTLKALQDVRHPYRQALDASLGAVSVIDISEALHVNRSTLDTETTVIVSSIQAFRIDNTEGRKVYEPNGSLMDHFSFDSNELFSHLDCYENGQAKPTVANLLNLRSPIVIIDEAHNARTSLSFEMLTRFNPSCIIEFTATPDIKKNPSNVLYSVSASELYNENMIKMPIHLTNRGNWKEILTDAIQCRKKLEEIANNEKIQTGEYLRPIMLIQAQPTYQAQESITYEVVKKCLTDDFGIPEEYIAVSTGNIDDLKNEDITGTNCEYRYIITVQKLKEGWDCPFAYVLCSLATMRSPTAVEQIVGRVLRMPKAKRKNFKELNAAYAFAVSPDMNSILKAMSDALVENGFERQEAKDLISYKNAPEQKLLFEDRPLFPQKTTVHIPNIKHNSLSNLPENLKNKISVDQEKETLTFEGFMNNEDKQILVDQFPSPEGKTAVEKIFHRSALPRIKRNKTPSEIGLSFAIPVLALKQGNLFEIYEEQHFLDYEWVLSECDAELTESEYSGQRPQGESGIIEITKDGKIQTEYVKQIQNKFEFFFNKSNWDEARLVRWLDRNIPHPDISAEDSGIFLTNVINKLISQRNFSIHQLVQDKFNLQIAVKNKIFMHRKNARNKIHQTLLFGENSKIVVTPEKCFSFKADPLGYPYNRLYDGKHKFKKHYYPRIGAFGSQEETDCAVFIDSLDEIDFWVRNLEKNHMYGFWLQTSTDKFYPDFVCRLKDGRNLVVEYKGKDRYTNEDSREKRVLGELWAERSNGSCLFIMTNGMELEPIRNLF